MRPRRHHPVASVEFRLQGEDQELKRLLGGTVSAQLASKPAFGLVSFQRVWAVAIKALECALSLAARRQRKELERPAVGTRRSFGLAHADNLPPG